jgi:hypothetical protein
MMIYRIVTYDKLTERMAGSLPIPRPLVAEIRKIAGVSPLHDGLGEYPLNEEQTSRVAQLLGFPPAPERFHYYLEPYDQPDNGLTPGQAVAR